MTKTNLKQTLFAILSVLFVATWYTPARAETQVGLTDEQKSQIQQKARDAVSELTQLASQFQQKLKTFRNTKYTFQLSDAEADSKARYWARTVPPNITIQGRKKIEEYIRKRYDELLPKFKAKSYNESYDSFIGWGNGNATKELGWSKEDERTAENQNISLDGPDFSDTDLHWDKVISQARKQMSIEKNPEQGAGKAIKEAEALDDLKTSMIDKQYEIKGYLAALNPSNNISVDCMVSVNEGEECPPDKMVYTIVTEDGKAATGASKGCTPLPAKYAEIQTCILCPLFEIILKTDQTMATKSFGALAPSFINVLIVVMALFIAYHTLMTVSSFTKQDAPKYITTLLVQGFKVLLAALLLSDPTYIYYYIINPLMSAGLEFGLAMLFKADLLADYSALTQEYAPGMPTGVIGSDLLGGVMAAVRLFNKAAAQMPAIGSSLICISTHEASWQGIFPDFSMFIEGVLIYAFGWAIALSCCFYLLDSAVRFGIFCSLLPFLIACWPFKVTASYTGTGWKIFMNAFFNFVMMGLIISLNTELIAQALTGGKGGVDELEAAINGSEVKKLEELMDISGIDFLVLVACCMFAFKLVGQINMLATEIAGGGGGQGIGSKIGGAAAQATKKVGGMAMGGAKTAAGALSEGLGIKGKMGASKARVMSGLNKVGAKMGLGPKANPNGAGKTGANPGNGKNKNDGTSDKDASEGETANNEGRETPENNSTGNSDENNAGSANSTGESENSHSENTGNSGNSTADNAGDQKNLW